MFRRLLFIAASVLAVGLVSMAPTAAGGNYGGCSATVSDTTPSAGQTITVTGSGAADDGGTVTASIDGTTIGTGTSNSEGNFSFSATIPVNATGRETLAVSCGADRGTFPITLTIVSDSNTSGSGPARAGSGSLPATGASGTLPLTGIALGAMAVGAVVLGGARLRSRTLGRSEI